MILIYNIRIKFLNQKDSIVAPDINIKHTLFDSNCFKKIVTADVS